MPTRPTILSDFDHEFTWEMEELKKNEQRKYKWLVDGIVGGSFYGETLIINNEVCGVLYWWEYDNKSAYVCIYPTLAFLKYPKQGTKEVRDFIYNKSTELGYERVETRSLKTPNNDKWHKILGFTLEGECQKFYKGETYNLWGRLF